MTCCDFMGDYVQDYFLAKSCDFLETLLVAWQLVTAKTQSSTKLLIKQSSDIFTLTFFAQIKQTRHDVLISEF